MEIRKDDLTDPQSQDLIRIHLEGMRSNTPIGHVFALDLSGLKAPGVTVWSAWDESVILAIGALRRIDSLSGEVKSMRTHPDHLRKGAAAAVLQRIIAEAQEMRLSRLSLETGRGPEFEPALRLYRSRGFIEGPPFADYEASPFNQFLHLDLS